MEDRRVNEKGGGGREETLAENPAILENAP